MNSIPQSSSSNSSIGNLSGGPSSQQSDGLGTRIQVLSASPVALGTTASAREYKKMDFSPEKLDLSGMDLSNTSCRDKDWSKTNLTHANLSNTDLSGGNFYYTNLTNANCTNVKWDNAHIRNPNLTGTLLSKLPPNVKLSGIDKPFLLTADDTPIAHAVPLGLPREWNRATLQYRLTTEIPWDDPDEAATGWQLTCTYVDDRQSLLTQIIDTQPGIPCYADQGRDPELALQLMESIKQSKADTSCVSSSLLSFLARYQDNLRLTAWSSEIFSGLLSNWDEDGMPLLSETMHPRLHQYLDSHPEEMAEHSFAYVQYFVQVMAGRTLVHGLSRDADDESTRNCSIGPPSEITEMLELYNKKYLTLDRVSPYTEFFALRKRPTTNNKHNYDDPRIPPVILLSKSNPHLAIVLTQQVLLAIADKDEITFDKNKHNFWVINNQQHISTAEMNLREICETYKDYFPLLKWRDGVNIANVTILDLKIDPETRPVIRPKLASVSNVHPAANEFVPVFDVRPTVKVTASKVEERYSSLKNLLGEVLAMNDINIEMRNLFNNATRPFARNKNLISHPAHLELTTAFAPCISTSGTKSALKEPHYQQISEKISSCCNSNTEKAAALMCLSAIFVRYASGHVFGIEPDLPIPLQNYAHALLRKAVELDPGFLDGDVPDWEKHLFNPEKISTSALFAMMRAKLLLPETEKIAKQIIPPAWLY